jgi:hypothetical protein
MAPAHSETIRDSFIMRLAFMRHAGAILLSIAAADACAAMEALAGNDWTAVTDDRLDSMRGGFEIDSSLTVSFGIQRAVYVDGNLVTAASVTVPDLARITTAQADALRTSAGAVSLVQNGVGNAYDTGAMPAAAVATVIQNSLNNQEIRSLTVIDATVNTLGALKALNFATSMRDALNVAAGGK